MQHADSTREAPNRLLDDELKLKLYAQLTQAMNEEINALMPL